MGMTCSCPYPDPKQEDIHRGCPIHGDLKDYPEHRKLEAVKEKSQAIGEFLDYSGYVLCAYDNELREYVPTRESIQRLLAEWFGIDYGKLMEEKDRMLEQLRALNS